MISNMFRLGLLAGCIAATGAAQAAEAAAPVAAGAASETAAPRLPLEAFARLPLLQDVVLSPNGKHMAALMNVGDDTVVITRDLAGSDASRGLWRTDNRQYRFAWLRWVNDDRLVVSVQYPSRRGWAKVGERRLISVRRDGSGMISLVRRPSDGQPVAQIQDRVIDWLPDDGQHVLLELVDESGGAGVYRVNVETAERRNVQEAQRNTGGWMTDLTHRVRVATRWEKNRVEVRVNDADGKNWRTAWSYELFGPEAVVPLGFGKDPNKLFVLADHQGHQAVFEVDLRDPALPRRLVLSDPKYDLGGSLLIDPSLQDAVGLRMGVVGDAASVFWHPQAKALLQGIDKALPDRSNQLLQFSADGSRYLMHSIGNGSPGHYKIGFRDTGEISELAPTYPALADDALARKKAVTIKARDGVLLPSFLTLPQSAGAQPGAPLPAVILPHGGPISMDSPVFDPWVQFLANRGYAVLQVNFRGSSGLGHAHMSAGLKRWGLEMQDDLSDAVAWLNGQRISDPARICIVGGSYGGYAALMGVVKTPELYRCAVSFAGVSDLVALAAHAQDFRGGEAVFSRQIGSFWNDQDALKATSPSLMAEAIRAPVLLVHGTADLSVPYDQSELMASALKRAGKRYKLVKQEDGDHHLSNQAHRLQFFRELEAFLAEHLDAPAQASNAKP